MEIIIFFKIQGGKSNMERNIKNEKWKEFIEDFEKNPQKWYKSQLDDNWEFDEETQLKIVKDSLYNSKYDQFSIKFIKNPTEQVCLETVKQDSYAIQDINNPTEEVCLTAVKKDGFVIKFIDNPTEEMCLEAVKQNGYSIIYIDNPTKEIYMEAIKQNSHSIEYIKNPSKELCLIAVKQDGCSIESINNPTEEMCLEAVKQNGEAIEYIFGNNQSFDIVQAFFDYNWSKSKFNRQDYYKYLSKKFITKEQAIIMIQDDPENINLVSEKIQKELIEMNSELEKYLYKEGIKNIKNFFE